MWGSPTTDTPKSKTGSIGEEKFALFPTGCICVPVASLPSSDDDFRFLVRQIGRIGPAVTFYKDLLSVMSR